MYITYQNHVSPYRLDWRHNVAQKTWESLESENFDQNLKNSKNFKKSKKN